MYKEDETVEDTDLILKKLINFRSYFNLFVLLFGTFSIFMLGLGAFTSIVSFLLVPLFLIVSPFSNRINFEIGPFNGNTPGEAVIFFIAGLVFLSTLLFFVDLIISFVRKEFSFKFGSLEFGNKEKVKPKKNKKK